MNERTIKKVIIPVENIHVIKSLRQFSYFMRSCVGQNSGLKLLVKNPSCINLTSSSSILADNLDVDCYICLFLLRMSKVLPDFGLYFNIAASSFLIDTLHYASLNNVTYSNLVSYIEKLKTITASIVNSSILKQKVEAVDLRCMLKLINGQIDSKPSTKSHKRDISSFILNIAKAFLSCITDQKLELGNLIIIVEDGTEFYSTYQGVMLPSSMKNEFINNKLSNMREVKVLIFLTLEFDRRNHVCHFIDYIFDRLEVAINNGVKVIVCQRLVDEKVKLFLSRRKVVVFERVGEYMTQSLEHLTSAVPLSGIEMLECEDIMHLTGVITNIKQVTCGFKKYILLQNDHSSITTLMVQSRMLGGQNEVKTVVRQCVNSLKEFMESPFVILGAGQFERKFRSLAVNSLEKDEHLYYFMNSFCQCLLQASGLFPNSCISKDYLNTNENETEEISNFESTCNKVSSEHEVNVSYNVLDRELSCSNVHRKNYIALNETSIFDCYETKIGALYHVFDAVINVFEIGLIVKK